MLIGQRRAAMDKNSTEFNYGQNADTSRDIKKSGPSWLLIILIVAVSVIGIIALGMGWLIK